MQKTDNCSESDLRDSSRTNAEKQTSKAEQMQKTDKRSESDLRDSSRTNAENRQL